MCTLTQTQSFVSDQGADPVRPARATRWSGLQALARLAATGLILAASVGVVPAQAREFAPGLDSVALVDLPREAQRTHQLILSGGPFPYEKDGTTFMNRERLLPSKARGHYKEYTVRTPGARNRGARRIVCGGRAPTAPESCFYTADHYASFKRIVP